MNPFTFTRYTFGLEYKKFTPYTVYFFLIWLLSLLLLLLLRLLLNGSTYNAHALPTQWHKAANKTAFLVTQCNMVINTRTNA